MIGIGQLTRSRRCVSKLVMILAVMTAVAIASVIGLNIATNAVSIYDGSDVKTVYTFSDEPEMILDQAGVALGGNDGYTFTGLNGGSGQIRLVRAFPVTIDAFGNTYRLQTAGGTVRDALTKAGVALDEYDTVNFSLDDELSSGMAIAVTDIEYTSEIKRVEIPYDTTTVYSDSMEDGKTSFKAGTPGVKVITYTYKIVNGSVTDTQISDETVTSEPVNAVKTIGTKEKITDTYHTCGANYVSTLEPNNDFAVDENGLPTNYSRVISGKASAYSGGVKTSTGYTPRVGFVAVNPNQIPYGTRLFIRSQDGSCFYGYAVAQDTGSFINSTDRVVDLYFSSQAECIRFGVRNVDIYVLD